MKTPEEIKRGLEYFPKYEDCTMEGLECPCFMNIKCSSDLMHDALEYINELEARTSLNTLREEETITRCKDCKRWGAGYPSETDKIKCCQIAGYLIGENGYCLYADKKNVW